MFPIIRIIPFLLSLLACVVAVMLVPRPAFAAPFVIVDVPSAAADKCSVAMPSTAPAVDMDVTVDAAYGVPANGNRVCKIDAASAPTGDTTLTVALKSDLWGVMGSPVPFTFTRPSSASLVPGSIGLKK